MEEEEEDDDEYLTDKEREIWHFKVEIAEARGQSWRYLCYAIYLMGMAGILIYIHRYGKGFVGDVLRMFF